MPAESSDARLRGLFDAWAALCTAAGRRSLSAAMALEKGTPETRAAVGDALLTLGYPEAMSSPRALGNALRSARSRRSPDGRWLDRCGSRVGTLWFVAGNAIGVAA